MCNSSTTLQDHMRHVLQHSPGRKTNAYKGANHLATLEIRAALLRVNTTHVQCCANVRETQCNNFNRPVLPLTFEKLEGT